ncbi:MAG: CsiV family protein [Pseudomonadota bacterium]
MTRLLATLILLVAATHATAQTWHQVHVVVFENPGTAGGGEEFSTAPDRAVEYPENMVEIEGVPASDAPGHGDTTSSTEFRSAEITDKEFSSALANLQRSSQYRVLAVKSWVQPAMGRDEATAVRITGGDTFGAHHQLDGSVRLITSQTLHFETNLWLGDYAAQPANVGGPAPAPEFSAGDIDAQAEPPVDADFVATRLINIRDSRAMNSGDLHYLDHPMLGVLVKVVRLKSGNP